MWHCSIQCIGELQDLFYIKMEVEKKQLQTFYDVLKGTEGILNLADSRLRDKFMDQIAIHAQTYARERTKYILLLRGRRMMEQ